MDNNWKPFNEAAYDVEGPSRLGTIPVTQEELTGSREDAELRLTVAAMLGGSGRHLPVSPGAWLSLKMLQGFNDTENARQVSKREARCIVIFDPLPAEDAVLI
jgi:hypothetical protein